MKTMFTPRCKRLRLWALLLPAAFCLLPAAFCTGFAEPPVIFYGQINQTYNGYTVPVGSGTLRWTIQATSTGSTPVTATTTPGLVSNQSFYRLEIPVQKLPPGYALSANTISTASLTYNRGTLITLDGNPLSIVIPPVTNTASFTRTKAASGNRAVVAAAAADLTTFTFTETARGKMDRIDLAVTTPFLDSDGDGLPDWFEDKYGLNKYDPSDAATLDPAGRSYLDDYNNHVDPNSAASEYMQWAATNSLQGAVAVPLVDADHDGIPNVVEFALGTNPNVPDNALAAQRSLVQVEAINGTRYLTMTVQKPGRTSVTYTVESSGDLVNWSSAEGTAVVTLTNTASLLKVRTVKSVDTPNGGPGFLRLRVLLNQ